MTLLQDKHITRLQDMGSNRIEMEVWIEDVVRDARCGNASNDIIEGSPSSTCVTLRLGMLHGTFHSTSYKSSMNNIDFKHY